MLRCGAGASMLLRAVVVVLSILRRGAGVLRAAASVGGVLHAAVWLWHPRARVYGSEGCCWWCPWRLRHCPWRAPHGRNNYPR